MAVMLSWSQVLQLIKVASINYHGCKAGTIKLVKMLLSRVRDVESSTWSRKERTNEKRGNGVVESTEKT